METKLRLSQRYLNLGPSCLREVLAHHYLSTATHKRQLYLCKCRHLLDTTTMSRTFSIKSTNGTLKDLDFPSHLTQSLHFEDPRNVGCACCEFPTPESWSWMWSSESLHLKTTKRKKTTYGVGRPSTDVTSSVCRMNASKPASPNSRPGSSPTRSSRLVTTVNLVFCSLLRKIEMCSPSRERVDRSEHNGTCEEKHSKETHCWIY